MTTVMSMAADSETIRIRIPIKVRTRAGRKEVVAVQNEPTPQEALLRAVARAHMWQALLDSGEVNSISALATRFHVDHSYVARTLRLASLAPDIVEMIITGDEPDAVTLNRLMRPWPVGWEGQRAELCGEGGDGVVP